MAAGQQQSAGSTIEGIPADSNEPPFYGIPRAQKPGACVVTYGSATPRNNVHLIRIHTRRFGFRKNTERGFDLLPLGGEEEGRKRVNSR